MLPGVPKRFNGDIEADFVPKLKYVRQGLRDCVDLNVTAVNYVSFNALMKCGATEMNKLCWKPNRARYPYTSLERDPDIGRELSADPVEIEGRKQADNATWRSACDQRQCVVFANGAIGEPVLPARRALKHTGDNQAR